MIICFEGTPGSGKSYEAVRKIIDNLRLGRIIYTNIDGIDIAENRESIKSYTGLTDYELATQLNFLPHYQIHEFWKFIKNGSLVLIDEAHKIFSNRDWASAKNKEFADWASTHRHFGFDVVMITQNLGKIDTHVRSLVEWTYRYKKMNMFGNLVNQKYKRASYCGEDTIGKPLDNKLYTYDKRIFDCYKSFVANDVKELKIMAHSNVLKHPIFLLIPVILVIFVFLASRSFGGGMFSKILTGKPIKSAAVVSENIVKPSAAYPPVELAALSPPVVAVSDGCRAVSALYIDGDIINNMDCGQYVKTVKNGVELYRHTVQIAKNESTQIPIVH